MGSSYSTSSKKAKKKTPPAGSVTEVDRQVLGLKTQKRKLNAYAKRVEEAISRETAAAAAFAKDPASRAKALHALRRRKLQRQLADRVDGWLMQVEELLASIEQAQATAAVLERLKQGNEALRRAQSGYSIEDVQSVLSDLEEAKEREEEVNAMLSERLTEEEDAAAEAELEALEAEEEAAEAKTRPNANENANAAEREGGRDASPAEVSAAMPAAPSSAPELPDAPTGEIDAGRERVSSSGNREMVPA